MLLITESGSYIAYLGELVPIQMLEIQILKWRIKREKLV